MDIGDRGDGGIGAELVAAADRCVASWIVRCVTRFAPSLTMAAEEAGERARAEVVADLTALVVADVDAQRTNPLTVLREATRHANDVLRVAGVPPVRRDEFARRAFPDDAYGLSPATWSDVDPTLVEPGVRWGAWKAATVLQRRRREGLR